MANLKGNKSVILSTHQKEKIVLENKELGLTFKELSIKYGVSYFSVRRWCLDYEIGGVKALESKTGKNPTNPERSTSIDPKDREIAKLRKELKQSKMENEILKKFDELIKGKLKKK